MVYWTQFTDLSLRDYVDDFDYAYFDELENGLLNVVYRNSRWGITNKQTIVYFVAYYIHISSQ